MTRLCAALISASLVGCLGADDAYEEILEDGFEPTATEILADIAEPEPPEDVTEPAADVATDEAALAVTSSFTLRRPPAALVARAKAAPLGWFGATSAGERYCANCTGASIVLAVASFTGDTSADARLLQQMRYVLSNNRDPFGNGGYMAQHERMMTAMFALAKRTPRVWSKLSVTEARKIDLVMKATLVGSAYTTADKSYANGDVPTGLDGDTNLHRGWNPNYREGMVGAVLVSTLYLGGRAKTEAFLDGYDHVTFKGQLKKYGLTRLYSVFNSSRPGHPWNAQIESNVSGYRYYGRDLGQLFTIWVGLANDTFSTTVSCGLNDGAGVQVNGVASGRLIAGCAGLPNRGKRGQLKEFQSTDAKGKRSATFYAFDGYKPDLNNQLVLIAYGAMTPGATLEAVLDKVDVGSTDLFYKVKQGYRNYAKGRDYGVFQLPANGVGNGYEYYEPLWNDVLAPTYGR